MTKACENIAYFTPFTPIQSPINYTGSKARLLPQILPLFPREMETCVDLFCGGGSVKNNLSLMILFVKFTKLIFKENI
ncbi:DNA adenine methylase [Helicobacter canis]|uniref:DNA adenine methylase n=1 Tax=Helicobacter canis TaxID=29419 RepID=UPI002942E59F|nr:DNA adenine methylase [Helicobacter canis]